MARSVVAVLVAADEEVPSPASRSRVSGVSTGSTESSGKGGRGCCLNGANSFLFGETEDKQLSWSDGRLEEAPPGVESVCDAFEVVPAPPSGLSGTVGSAWARYLADWNQMASSMFDWVCASSGMVSKATVKLDGCRLSEVMSGDVNDSMLCGSVGRLRVKSYQQEI